MTVQEAIKYVVKEVCEDCYGSDEPMGDCKTCGVKIALECMEEVEQYRALGTVEELTNQKHNLSVAYRVIDDYSKIGTVESLKDTLEELDRYRDLGTIEELEEALNMLMV